MGASVGRAVGQLMAEQRGADGAAGTSAAVLVMWWDSKSESRMACKAVGEEVGAAVGVADGTAVGLAVGVAVGAAVGASV